MGHSHGFDSTENDDASEAVPSTAPATGSYDIEQLDCTAVIADVWLMLDNECDDATRMRLQRHIDSCGSCLAAYGIEEKIKSLVSRKCGGDQAPAGLRERLSLEIRRTVLIKQTSNRDS